MNQLVTTGIVLTRTNFGEADRIITFLTPDQGKLRLMARGVRKSKSKLAGGIELFSVSDITFIRGRGDVGTLVSTRLQKHYAGVVQDIDRTMLGYDLIKQLNKVTEDEPEPEYFELLSRAFESLDDTKVADELIRTWFSAQLLRISGHSPNLQTDHSGQKLAVDQRYNFSFDDMSFAVAPAGRFNAAHIKLLRLLFSNNSASAIANVQGVGGLIRELQPLVQAMRSSFLTL